MATAASSNYVPSHIEKTFLLFAERGDCASIKKILDEYKNRTSEFNINCLDPLNRSALIIAIEKENIDLITLLLEAGIQLKDSLLHAIDEEYVEGVDVLLEWEEKHNVAGQPWSWELVDKYVSGFALGVTPVVLAAHKNNYEILKLLLDRGAAMPIIHDVHCNCDECVCSKKDDSLRHSQARINSYRALISPSLICLSSEDPLLTAIELYGELKRLERIDTEFRAEYKDMRQVVQTFATSLLDHVRTSEELEIILNHDTEDHFQSDDRQSLSRLKLAIKVRLKMFVAHPNVQQLLATIWYKGLPGFRGRNMFSQGLQVVKIASNFVIYSVAFMIAPKSSLGCFLKNPFIKFVCHSASDGCFLGLLSLASQRVENLVYELLGDPYAIERTTKERGSMPGIIEWMIIVYIISLIWKEVRALYEEGIIEYIGNLWNILDYISNMFYIMWISLRATSIYIVWREQLAGHDPWYPRDQWDKFDPHLVSECAFASGMILSFMKLVNIFSINPHLGPLQISLGRMIIDIIKFFFIYTLVLFAFGCGLNQLLWYFAELEEMKCYHTDDGLPDFDGAEKACTTWRRFANLFETSQSLFWASFGLVDLTAFDLTGIKSFTRFWGLLIFGCYSAINIIVLLNMLIAMMSNSYQIISERADTEWKFARSKLFISYFGDDDVLPPPFNLCPTIENCVAFFSARKKSRNSFERKRQIAIEIEKTRYCSIMQLLVRRYITIEQKRLEEFPVTEDDIAEVRHDISTLRFELLDLFRQNNFVVPKGNQTKSAQGRRERVMERRIIKDFQIGAIEGAVNEIVSNTEDSKNIFGKIAKAIGRSKSKRRTRSLTDGEIDQIYDDNRKRGVTGSTRFVGSRRAIRHLSMNRYISRNRFTPARQMDAAALAEYNPALEGVPPLARIAYAKFKANLIEQDKSIRRGVSVEEELITRGCKKNAAGIISQRSFDAERMSKTAVPKTISFEKLDETQMAVDHDAKIKTPLRKQPAVEESVGGPEKEVSITVERSPIGFKKGTARDGNWL